MPNWCNNKLIIDKAGPGLMEWLRENGLSFQKILPVETEDPDGFEQINEQAAAWGTKWDLGDDMQEVTDTLCAAHEAVFLTAWAPPTPVVQALASKFPGTELTLYYYEPGMQFAGSDRITSTSIQSECSEKPAEVRRIAIEEFAEEPEDFEDDGDSEEIAGCNCGSKKQPEALFDARGIYVAKVCHDCIKDVKSKYRPEIFTGSDYETSEDIEPD